MDKLITCGSLVAVLAAGCDNNFEPLEVVQQVDLARYSGTWYEISRYPTSFQSGCVGTTATYTLNDDGTVNVLNSCFENSFDGPLRTVVGTARTVDGSNNAKLKVRFFLFDGDYWILRLGDAEDYGHAVVGEPSRRFLWILSRTPELDASILDDILESLPGLGYDPAALIETPQPAGS